MVSEKEGHTREGDIVGRDSQEVAIHTLREDYSENYEGSL